MPGIYCTGIQLDHVYWRGVHKNDKVNVPISCYVNYSASQKSLNGTCASLLHFGGITHESSLDLYARYLQTEHSYSPITR